jgi:hypothetical protein
LCQSSHGHLQHRPVLGDAGVVHEDVQGAVLIDDLADDALAILGLADVALVHARVRAAARHLLDELLGPLEMGRVAGGEGGALGGQAAADGGADAAATARHERGAALEFESGAQLHVDGGKNGVGH